MIEAVEKLVSKLLRHLRLKIADIEAKISSLKAMRQSLRKLMQTCDGCAPVSECPILESLDKEDS